ncbi:MAG TPA: phosphoribosylformylglycinamidine synthase subunit PurQ [Syntrophorhabdaceae bacterium]|nr:phosphoribosylformylglycinamidine synthase subunit PurQ [Syntrophorhabdaceae bacterium]
MKKKTTKSLVVFGNGINCEQETAYANKLAGFRAELMHIDEMTENPKRIRGYGLINFPGGFLDGDDLGSAKAQAVKWKYRTMEGSKERFLDELTKFVASGGLIIGICNGFQLLVKTGLLPALAGEYGKQTTTLTANDSGRFEDRWVCLKVNRFSHCIFTRDMDTIYLPVRHGEGKCVVDTPDSRRELNEKGHVVMQYADESGAVSDAYPYNPNGSTDAIAALTDPTGRVFGLMPHPEAFVHYTQHPRWTREALNAEGDGLKIFRNAYRYIVENQ